MIGIFPGSKSSPHLKLFGSSRPRNSGGKEAALRIDEFYKGETKLRGECKEDIIEAVLPKERLLMKKRGSIPCVWFLAETEIYFDSFCKASGPGEKINRHS